MTGINSAWGRPFASADDKADGRDLPWWGRMLYGRSRWFTDLCVDAWSFRRMTRQMHTVEKKVGDPYP